MHKKEIISLLIITIILFLSNDVLSQTEGYNYIISNSDDWKDVYSIMHYATIKEISSDFLVSTRHGALLLNGINKENSLRIISSKSNAFVINYEGMAKDMGFNSAEEIVVNSANLELIEDLADIKNFVIVSDKYGYNAIAVAPYAVVNNAWVFFSNRINIDEIDSLLTNREVDELLIYGYVDRDVKDTLSKYNPVIIDSGDRFEDNIQIMEKYLKIKPVKQIVLSNGEFIEKEIMSGLEPVLFTGKQNVPEQIANYLKGSDIDVAVLVGADLVGAATNIRRTTGISVIVKFARGSRAPTGAVSSVEGLDLFYLPTPIMDLKIHSARYNKATSQLELTYRSESNIPIYFKGTITPSGEGIENTRMGDIDPVFIAPNDFKTVTYSDLNFAGNKLAIEVFTLFGDTPSSLERILEATLDVEIVNIIDNCKIDVKDVKYSKQKDAFAVKISNTANVDCWADVELKDVLIDDIETTIGSEGSINIPKGDTIKLYIEQDMTDEDLDNNEYVNLIAYYGEKEDSLINVFQGKFKLGIEFISYGTIGLVLLILIVIISIIILVVIIRRRKEEEYW